MKPDNNNILNKLKEILHKSYSMERPAPEHGRWIINPAPKNGSSDTS